MPESDLIRPGEAARLLGVDTSTLYRWECEGRLSAAQKTLGGQRRYRRADIIALTNATPA